MSNMGNTPIIDAVNANDIVECRRLIETQGADIHQKDTHDLSPIIWGSLRGCLDIIELLLSKGANIHDKDKDSRSPILMTSLYGRFNVIDLLLSKGASLHDTSNDGRTCYSSALDPEFNPDPYQKHGPFYRLRKWPTTMAILVLTELALIYRIDCSSLIDLYQYIGREDFTRDNEEEYTQ